MMAWRIYLTGALLFMCIGIAFSLPGDKGYFLKLLAVYRHTIADYYFLHVTKLGEEYGFVIIGVLLWLRSWRKMLVIPFLGLIVTVMSYILKKSFHHERPLLYLRRIGWDGPLAVLDYKILAGYASFPSGHSMAAWALFTLTAALIRKPWVSILCLFLAASVSISRVYLMVHFLRDVLAGAAIGFSLGVAIYYVYDNWMKKSQLAQPEEPKQG